jgi:hypothetical protein
MNIAIEAETPGDNRTMFRVTVDQEVVASELTAASAHWLVGVSLERITHPELANANKELEARQRRQLCFKALSRRP